MGVGGKLSSISVRQQPIRSNIPLHRASVPKGIRLLSARNPLGILLLSCFLVACAGTTAPDKQALILGNWEGNSQGQSIVLTYTATEVLVEAFGVSFPYEWLDEDTIRLDAMGQEVVSTIEFDGPDVMRQRSPQGVQTLQRVP